MRIVTRLHRIVLFVVLVAGCSTDANENLGRGGGGGRGSILDSGSGPADIDASAKEVLLSGRICQISDLRRPTMCAASPANIQVRTRNGIRTRSAANGSYSLTIRSETSLDSGAIFIIDVAVGHNDLRTTSVSVKLDSAGLSGFDLPVIAKSDFARLLTTFPESIVEDDATIITYFSRDNTPVEGATIFVGVTGARGLIRYDTTGPSMSFTSLQLGTGPAGAALMTGIAVGATTGTGVVSYSVRIDPRSEVVNLTDVPVRAGGLTLVFFQGESTSP